MNQRKLYFSTIVFALAIFTHCRLLAQPYHKEIPDVPIHAALVHDLADMLSDEQELQLETKLYQFEQQTSNEITIVTVDTLGELDPNTFALELGRKWGIGKELKKNGVILLASKKDRKLNISPGYGLQGALPDVICARIIREYLVPNFRSQNYYQGFNEASDAIIKATQGEFVNDGKTSSRSGLGMILLLFLIFGLIFVFFYLIRNRKNVYVSSRGYRYDDEWSHLPRSSGGWFSSGGWGDSGGGGGFGGFGGGGGGFDGGGASGSW